MSGQGGGGSFARDIGERVSQTQDIRVTTGAKYFGGSNRNAVRLTSKDKQVLMAVTGISVVAFFAFKYLGRK